MYTDVHLISATFTEVVFVYMILPCTKVSFQHDICTFTRLTFGYFLQNWLFWAQSTTAARRRGLKSCSFQLLAIFKSQWGFVLASFWPKQSISKLLLSTVWHHEPGVKPKLRLRIKSLLSIWGNLSSKAHRTIRNHNVQFIEKRTLFIQCDHGRGCIHSCSRKPQDTRRTMFCSFRWRGLTHPHGLWAGWQWEPLSLLWDPFPAKMEKIGGPQQRRHGVASWSVTAKQVCSIWKLGQPEGNCP